LDRHDPPVADPIVRGRVGQATKAIAGVSRAFRARRVVCDRPQTLAEDQQ
jgi:hypothetical protein